METTTIMIIWLTLLSLFFLGLMIWVKDEIKAIREYVNIQSYSLSRKIQEIHQKLCEHKEKIDLTSSTSTKTVFVCADCDKQFIEEKIKDQNQLEKYIAEQLVKDVINDMKNLYPDDRPTPKGRVINKDKSKDLVKGFIEKMEKEFKETIRKLGAL